MYGVTKFPTPGLTKTGSRRSGAAARPEEREIYRKSAELTRAALLPDREDLGNLARDAQDARASLQYRKLFHVQQPVDEERPEHAGQHGHERSGVRALPGVVQHEHGDHDILRGDEGRLAVGAEREPVARVVGEGHDVRGRLEEIGEDADAGGGLGGEQLEDLRHLDDGSGGDDAETEAFRDGELQALSVGQGDVADEGCVAVAPEEGEGEVVDGRWEVARDGLQQGAQVILEDVHFGWLCAPRGT